MGFFCDAAECTSHSSKAKQLEKYPFMRDVCWVRWPTDQTAINRWKRLIRRGGRDKHTGHVDKLTLTRGSRLCSRHFRKTEIDENGCSLADPSLFAWNNWGQPLKRRDTQTIQKLHNSSSQTQEKRPGEAPTSDEVFYCSTMSSEMVPDIGCEVTIDVMKSSNSQVKIGKMTPLQTTCNRSPSPDHDYLQTTTPKLVSSAIQTDMTLTDITNLTDELEKAKSMCKPSPEPQEIVRQSVIDSDERVKYYTGIDSKDELEGVFHSISDGAGNLRYWTGSRSAGTSENYEKKNTGPQRKLTRLSEFIMTLMRLRLNLPLLILADMFGVGCTLVTSVTITWISYLHQTLVPALLIWPSKTQVTSRMPTDFKSSYPNTRALIDCSEFYAEKPANKQEQYATFSTYKHHNTFKALISTTPNGLFSFVSNMWSGNVSDRYITENSGFLDLVEEEDDIMADRGFPIEDCLAKKGAKLLAPPFTRKWDNGKGKRFNVSEIRKTKQIARLRIHIERAIQRLKTFRILKHIIPASLKDMSSMILQVIAALCNLKGHLFYGRDEQHLKRTQGVKRKKPVKRCKKDLSKSSHVRM